MYTVDYFIQKFQAIPEDMFCTDKLFDNGRMCAYGHCGVKKDRYTTCQTGGYTWNYQYTEEGLALVILFSTHFNIETWEAQTEIVPSINDGDSCRYEQYKQPTPKQRILAALYDIKKMQYPELSNTTVEDLVGEACIEHKN